MNDCYASTGKESSDYLVFLSGVADAASVNLDKEEQETKAELRK